MVTTIGGYAFANCTSLKEIHIPQISSLGAGAFGSCTQLETVDWGSSSSLLALVA
jgi:hypothetical protein